jgi:NAD(P)-dependent dehydrogenase (short-subunit alcohol dehydrogenase family)
MKDFTGKVAVVTGAASGIGLGMARVFARQGMQLVLADVERATLRHVERELGEAGATALCVETDVSDRDAVMALADAAHERFGKVHLLCNNAGVGGATGAGRSGIWSASPDAWRWVVGVNFMGVVHGLQAFVDRMLAHGEPAHIVNTSSVVGVWSGQSGIYGVTKHAVTALTETLFHDLRAREAQIGVSGLLPGLTATRINTAARNLPGDAGITLDAGTQQVMERMEAHFLANGLAPERVAEIVLDGVRERRFYIFTHPQSVAHVESRMRAILDGTDPPESPSAGQRQRFAPDN